jgi:hypothetical protein
LFAMSAEPGPTTEPPPLPPVLLQIWPFIAVGVLAWLTGTAVAFLVPACETWRPIALAGLGTSVIGTSLFLLQLSGARRGSRGAQKGLESFIDPK